MRGNITQRGKNSWQLKFDVPSSDGRRRIRYATAHGTYKDAQRELTKLLGASDAPGDNTRAGSVAAPQCEEGASDGELAGAPACLSGVRQHRLTITSSN